MGDGVRGFLDPGRLVFGRARTAAELLWAAEEALRTGLVPLVVAELPAVPALTAGAPAAPRRRGRGGARRRTARAAPDPRRRGAPGIETRWHLAPAPGWARDGAARWRLTRLRARMAPERSWIASLKGRLRLNSELP